MRDIVCEYSGSIKLTFRVPQSCSLELLLFFSYSTCSLCYLYFPLFAQQSHLRSCIDLLAINQPDSLCIEYQNHIN